jgi:hypothetical protein
MDELRKMCEIVTSSPSDTNWVLKLLENQDILMLRLDAGSGREQFIIYEKIQ